MGVEKYALHVAVHLTDGRDTSRPYICTAILAMKFFTLHSSLFILHSSLFILHSSLFTLHSSLLYRYLPTQRLVHIFPDEFWVFVSGLQMHQFCHRTLHRTVVTAHHTGIL